MSRLLIFRWRVVAVGVFWTLAVSVSGQPGVSREAPPVHAHVTGQWALSRADGGAIGIVSRAAACPDRLYLMAVSTKTVYRIDLHRPSLEIALGPDVVAKVAKSSGELVNLFADCKANLLSLVINPLNLLKMDLPSFVATFDLGSRQITRTFDLPSEFSPNSEGAAHYDIATRHVYLAGIWPLKRNGWMTKPDSMALTDTAFGLSLSLDNGRASKFLEGRENGCRASVGHCLASFFARTQTGDWVFAHGLGAQLYMIRAGQTVRTMDMRSPMFRHVPGDSVPRKAPREEGLAWAYRNSEIRKLFVVDDQIVGVHAHHSTEKAGAGGWIDFTAYLNVFNQQGDRVYSDLRLSGLAVGASPDAVWVVSYRPERNNDATEIVLQRVSPKPAPARKTPQQKK